MNRDILQTPQTPNQIALFKGAILSLVTAVTLVPQPAKAQDFRQVQGDFSVMTNYGKAQTRQLYLDTLPICKDSNPNTTCKLSDGSTITQSGISNGVEQSTSHTLTSPDGTPLVKYKLRMSFAGRTKDGGNLYRINVEGTSLRPITFVEVRVGSNGVYSKVELDKRYQGGKFIRRDLINIGQSATNTFPTLSLSYNTDRTSLLDIRGVDRSMYK